MTTSKATSMASVRPTVLNGHKAASAKEGPRVATVVGRGPHCTDAVLCHVGGVAVQMGHAPGQASVGAFAGSTLRYGRTSSISLQQSSRKGI